MNKPGHAPTINKADTGVELRKRREKDRHPTPCTAAAPAFLSLMQPEFVYFGSGQQAPRNLLSNFSAVELVFTDTHICPEMIAVNPLLGEWMAGRAVYFPSSEHLWQALKAKTFNTFLAFSTGGRLSGGDVLNAIYREKGLRKWVWWMRKSCVGIAAKLAANPKHAVVLDLVGKMDYRRERLLPQVELAIWLAILRLK